MAFGRKSKDKEKVKLTKESYQKAKRIFTYIKPYRFTFVIGMIFLFLSSVTAMFFPMLMGQLLASAGIDFNVGYKPEGLELSNPSFIALMLFITFGFQSVFSFMRIFLFTRVTENTLADLRQASYKHLISLPLNFYHKNKVGELTSRISADISLLQEVFNTTLAEFLRQFITIFIGVSFLIVYSWKLAFIMLATLPIIALVAVFFGRFIKKLSKDSQAEAAKSNSIIEETLTAIQSVKAYTNEMLEFARYKRSTDHVKALSLKGGVWRGLFVSFIIFCMFGTIVFIVWKGVEFTKTGEISADQLISFILFTVFVGASIGSLPDLFSKIQKAIGATEHLMNILDQKNEEEVFEESHIVNKLERVVFKNVSFNYDSRKDVNVLKNVSFDIKAGNQVALVGSSGSGKSTIASLLMRFYDPISGDIKINDDNYSQLSLKDWRNYIAYVPQDVILFSGTVKDNVMYGKINASEEEVVLALKKANAYDFVMKFPEALNTEVGERGVQLSGGQKQRISIARAILNDPQLLILDEATSALDSESESLVQDALNNLMKDRTSLVIAHRLSTIKHADKILVLEDGEVKESGIHEELLALKDGLYAKLVEFQGK